MSSLRHSAIADWEDPAPRVAGSSWSLTAVVPAVTGCGFAYGVWGGGMARHAAPRRPPGSRDLAAAAGGRLRVK